MNSALSTKLRRVMVLECDHSPLSTKFRRVMVLESDHSPQEKGLSDEQLTVNQV
jgi:hypothetical protein